MRVEQIAVELGISRAAANALATLRHPPQIGDLRRDALKKLAQDYILALMLIAERGVKPTNKELIYSAGALGVDCKLGRNLDDLFYARIALCEQEETK